ncbi:KTSC domain-containing protein [Pseudomonas aeruginosa]|uniref:KTSC domain-containing protein n=1 Tax=Pseudomonas aeruginosa TaxID=287 RepID=UPI000F5335A8|nr:KTSC domain-containing protein [Pseudomonas aeruginosa]MBG7162014.1 KTSC domain-containing protein [Pseudomonas aeruginosa]MBI7242667.1 KTSC domain-containing protein [Pseudomonas aeruginosa]MBI8427338.1 KTSC domain-containing protein [Pseudomonas aeruginosa]MXP69368.1 KTSC domain-containing protein [Pseudomonas aeruginosa]MXP90515.1 KTSC domain-containing protein [Pseudomonas aeruginosa]
MERVSVSSSNIASVGHDASSQTLEVEFLNGSIYEYYDVPEHVYQELISASTVGGYFAQRVKNVYGFSRIG